MNKFKYPFKFYEKIYKQGSLDSKFKNKIQTAVSGTDHTLTTNKNKIKQKINIQLVTLSADNYRTHKTDNHPTKRPTILLKIPGRNYLRWKPVHLYKKRNPTPNQPRKKRRLAEKRRTAQKQQGPIYITKQKPGREGNGPESEHCVRRRI